jgi:nitrate reductase gamma subunit
VAIFCAGFAIRYLTARRPSAPPRRRLLLTSGLVLLFACHAAWLLFPEQVLRWNQVRVQFSALETLGFAAGLAAFAGWTGLLRISLRRSHASAISEVADILALAFAFAALLSGLLMAVRYQGGSSWAALTLAPYAQSLLRGLPDPLLADRMPFLVRLHIFSSLAALAAVPFTRAMPGMICALDRAASLLRGPAAAILRPAKARLESLAQKHNPAVWLWPEED